MLIANDEFKCSGFIRATLYYVGGGRFVATSFRCFGALVVLYNNFV